LKPFSDQILVQRIKMGDRRAAEKFVDVHYERVYMVLYSFCKNREIAEDLTQDTFIKVWNSIEQFHGLSRVSTWLYRIAYNTFIDWQRRQHCFDSLDDCEPEMPAVFFDDVTEKLLSCIRALPDKQREVMVLHYQHEFSFAEIANILNIPKGTVKSRLNAALTSLRQNAVIKELT
jgi:RNA polymerase sigma-70 factor (ECF subfamily)